MRDSAISFKIPLIDKSIVIPKEREHVELDDLTGATVLDAEIFYLGLLLVREKEAESKFARGLLLLR